MNGLYLKFPTLDDKEKWLEYAKERREENNSNNIGWEPSFEDGLKRRIKDAKGEDLTEGRVPSLYYFLMDGDRILGNVSIRNSIDTDDLSNYIGHIGYGIRQSERKKGYGSLILKLALEKCEELGLENVMVTCKEDNIGSSKVIEKNCGYLKEIKYVEEEKSNFKIYWINVKEALHKKRR